MERELSASITSDREYRKKQWDYRKILQSPDEIMPEFCGFHVFQIYVNKSPKLFKPVRE